MSQHISDYYQYGRDEVLDMDVSFCAPDNMSSSVKSAASRSRSKGSGRHNATTGSSGKGNTSVTDDATHSTCSVKPYPDPTSQNAPEMDHDEIKECTREPSHEAVDAGGSGKLGRLHVEILSCHG